MRIAIAHDYLTQRGGAERVVLSLSRAFPEAPIYTTLYAPDRTYPEFREKEVITSPLNRISLFRKHHRAALPLLAPVSNRIRIDADVVIASSSGWAHGFPSTGTRVVYCHNPARWLYQTDEYLGDDGAVRRRALQLLRAPLMRWDSRAAGSADLYLANSTAVRERIKRVYGFEADVVPPPFGIDASQEQFAVPGLEGWSDYLLVVSRLLPYKNVDKVVDAIRGTRHRLVIVGSGPLTARLRADLPANARLVSSLTDAQLRWVYSHARAVVAPAYEDFGLTPLEGAAFGKPTLALRAGGYLDTIVEGRTGVYFDRSSAGSIAAAIEQSERVGWDADLIREHAQGFNEARFITKIRAEVEALQRRH